MDMNSETLQAISLFGDLSEKQLKKIARLCSVKSISPGQPFFREGEQGKTVYLVPQGELEILFTSSGDSLACIEWVGAGDVLGIQALVPPHRYLTTARGVTEGTLLAINTVRLNELFQQDGQLAHMLLARLMGAALNRLAGLRART